MLETIKYTVSVDCKSVNRLIVNRLIVIGLSVNVHYISVHYIANAGESSESIMTHIFLHI